MSPLTCLTWFMRLSNVRTDRHPTLAMCYRFYLSEDRREWLLRSWEPDFPAHIRFTDLGTNRAEMFAKAEKFWATYIEPLREQRLAAQAKREADKAERLKKKIEKGEGV
jgi:hypothetical protein